MQKLKIRRADSVFAHGTSLGSGDLKIYPKYFDWYRGPDNINDIIVITDSHLMHVDTYSEKVKIALLIEPPSISSHTYQFIRENFHKFTYVLTHQKSLLNEIPNGHFYAFGGCWIQEQDRRIYPKSDNISIIASKKTLTEGHMLRHQVVNEFGEYIEGIYGRGYMPVANKLDALKDYRFSIVIENEKSDCWVTEKLIDVIMCGCIPIYWGCNDLAEFGFDTNGFICFDKKEQLSRILPELDKAYYAQVFNRGILVKNFQIAKSYTCPEDYIWTKWLEFTYKTINP